MKYRLLLILYLSLPLLGNAQEDLRNWRKGPLTWNDFKTFPHDSCGEEHSYLEFFLYIQETAEEHDGIYLLVQSAEACMDRKKSWVDSSWRTPEELRYNQVIFNLVELYRRYMQIELDTGGSPDIGHYMKLLVADVDTFCMDTKFGADTAAIAQWDDYIRQEMTAVAPDVAEKHALIIQKMSTKENYITTNRFSVSMGAGIKIPSNDFRKYFRTGGGFYMECEFGYGRQVLDFGMYIGGSKCLNTMLHRYNEEKDLWKNDDLTALDIKFDYGIALIDNYHFRLTPFVDIGALGYYTEVTTDDTYETTSVGPSTFSWRAGIDLRYHFLTNVTHSQHSSELSQITLFTKAYAEQARFSNCEEEPRGWTFNIVIGLAFHETTREYRE